ncbi:MAG: hypothetical protein PHC83_09295, partial [Bacteroidales bacterium]|nr:hypothetical protein [Bacteroidales bacterium]
MKKQCMCIGISLFLLIASGFSQTKEITLEDIWQKYVFYPQGVPGFTPMPNGDYYSVQNKEEIASYSFSTGEKQAGILTNYNLILASDNLIKLKDIDIYQMDNSERYLLLGIDYESIYR